MTTWWQRPDIFYCSVFSHLFEWYSSLRTEPAKGAIVSIPITKYLFKFVLTEHIFILGKNVLLFF